MAYKLLVPADIISSGEIADAHISVSSVEQHEAALEINEMGISGLLNLGEFLASTDTEPSEPGHMTRKAYVDAQVSALGGSFADNLAGAIADLEAADAAEVSARSSAVSALQADIAADSQALSDFIAASTQLHNDDAAALASYITSNNAAAAADAQALSDFIASANATHADDAAALAQLRTEFDSLTQGLDNEALDQIIEVIAAYEGADANLQQAITDLGTSSSSALSSAVADLEAADAALAADYDSKIAAADARAQAAEGVNAAAISAETDARVAAVAGVASDLADEADARAAADATEAAARLAGDAALQTAMTDTATVLQGNIDSLYAAHTADMESVNQFIADTVAAHNADVQALNDYSAANDAAVAADVAALAQLRSEYDALTAGLNSEDLDQIIEVIAAYEAADANLLQAINDLSTSSGSALAVETQARIDGDAAIQSDLDAWKASHVIGADTQAYSANLSAMEQGDFSTRPMKVKFETVAAGEGLVMGEDSFFVMCEAGSVVTLPEDAEVGRKVQLKAGVLGGNAVTVVGMIDGQSGMSMGLDYASMSLVYSGTTWLIG